MATYGDGLTDVDLPALVRDFRGVGEDDRCSRSYDRISTPTSSRRTPTEQSRDVRAMDTSGVRINGGFFVMRREIFDWIAPGDELVEETFAKLIPRGDVGGLRPRWVLRADGHDQGSPVARGAVRLGPCSLASRRPRPRRVAGRRDAPPRFRGRYARSARARDRSPLRRSRDRLRRHDSRADPRRSRRRGPLGRLRRAWRAGRRGP